MTSPDRRSETDPGMKMAATSRYQTGKVDGLVSCFYFFYLSFGAHYHLSTCRPSRSNHRDSGGISLVDVGVPWFLSAKE